MDQDEEVGRKGGSWEMSDRSVSSCYRIPICKRSATSQIAIKRAYLPLRNVLVGKSTLAQTQLLPALPSLPISRYFSCRLSSLPGF